MSIELEPIEQYINALQTKICDTIERLDGGATFAHDDWSRDGWGYGKTRVMADGSVFERVGVNVSVVEGDKFPQSGTRKHRDLAGAHYRAMGLSLVIHPKNPYVPTSHANVRVFVAQKPGEAPTWWFGGGFDLTPYYAFEEDCVHWHRTAKQACDPFGETIYNEFKRWCDNYFYLKHRQEARGIGGVFFDDLNHWDFDTCFAFMQSVGDAFLDAYVPIVEKRCDTPYGEREREFQLVRRGRYVEFNLIYDRGTLFGLQSGGRAESILVSMPPVARWAYQATWPTDSAEHQLTAHYLQPRDWVAS